MEQDRIIKDLETEDTLSLCRRFLCSSRFKSPAVSLDSRGRCTVRARLLALNKDNDELREKRTTLEALLVLEREEMADLEKAHEDLQASLVRLATEKDQLVRSPSRTYALFTPHTALTGLA